MLNLIFRYPKAFASAVVIHLIMGGLLVSSFEFGSDPKVALQPTEEEIVQAVAVDESAVQAEIDRLRRIEAQKRKAEQDRINKLEQKADAAKKAREKELKQLAELERQRKIESERKLKAEQERKEAEKRKRQAQLEQERMERERQAAEERKRQAEELAERTRQEALRLAKEQERQEMERLRQQQMAAEAQRIREQQETARVATEVDKYSQLIRAAAYKAWLTPANAPKGTKCVVRIRLSPVGDVINAEVTTGSGDPIFDRTALQAVERAKPFQVPKQPAVFDKLRVTDISFVKE